MAGILKCLIEEPNLTDEEVGKRFGYKAPFTKRYKSWLKKCGLIENTTKFILTNYGTVIYEKDNKLKKESSLWYMHSFLTSSEDIAEAWNFFYHTFLLKTNNFTKPELSNALSMKLMSHNPSHFGRNAPMIKVITKVLIDSYISKLAFGQLNIIESKDGAFHKCKIKTPYNWNNVESFSRLY
jgi:Protein of unknown function (DUF4007)